MISRSPAWSILFFSPANASRRVVWLNSNAIRRRSAPLKRLSTSLCTALASGLVSRDIFQSLARSHGAKRARHLLFWRTFQPEHISITGCHNRPQADLGGPGFSCSGRGVDCPDIRRVFQLGCTGAQHKAKRAGRLLGSSPTSRSAGKRTPPGPRSRTCVEIIVVLTSRCPRSSWIVRRSSPSSSRWVAKEWRNVWQAAGLAMPARRAAALTAR